MDSRRRTRRTRQFILAGTMLSRCLSGIIVCYTSVRARSATTTTTTTGGFSLVTCRFLDCTLLISNFISRTVIIAGICKPREARYAPEYNCVSFTQSNARAEPIVIINAQLTQCDAYPRLSRTMPHDDRRALRAGTHHMRETFDRARG